MEQEGSLLAIHIDPPRFLSATDALVNAAVGSCSFKVTLQAESDNSICFGGRIGNSYFRRKDRANSFTSLESSFARMTTQVSNHNGSESGFSTTPSGREPTAGLIKIATSTCAATK